MIGFEDIQSTTQETIHNHQDNTVEAVESAAASTNIIYI